LNHGEARFLKELLVAGGHDIASRYVSADAIVLFTCTVIGTTERKMLKRVAEFTKLGRPILASGCMAVVQQDALKKVNSDIHILKPTEIQKVNGILAELDEGMGGGPVHEINESPPVTINKQQTLLIEPGIPLDSGGEFEDQPGQSLDAIVPIATGCRGQCKYCITRLARGKLSSYPAEAIVDKVRKAVAAGHYEVRLTAQDTGCYGFDVGDDLAKLLNHITSLDTAHEFRVRVGMMNPDSVKPILDELIESYKHPRVFGFLHLPVQSGADELLAAMGRKYTVSEFLKIVSQFRLGLPGLTLSTDIIIGYPGETEEQFEHSMKLLRDLKPNIVNITRFSARPGTPAAKLKSKLPGSEVKARSRRMTKLRFEISKELNHAKVGEEYQVLVTERVKPGSVLCRTDNYLPVVLTGELKLGDWVQARITDATDAYLIGEVMM
jgi:MiaB-like tRNA modifying enzyme